MKNQIKNNSIILLCGHGSRSRAHSQNLIKVKKKIEKNINQKILTLLFRGKQTIIRGMPYKIL